MNRLSLAAFALAAFLAAAPSAAAHGVLVSTTPDRGESARRVPAEVSVVLTEAPAPGSRMEVRDGCGRDVAGPVQLRGDAMKVSVEPGAEPGPWRVSLRAVSGADGHPSRAAFGFRVRGERDCARAEGGVGDEVPPATSSRSPISDDGGSTFPWAVLAGITVVLLGGAVAIRRAGSR